jgi:2-polyprenyl-3-methyl-5-hydroxy-6-metoxy-1,4-benzoquinol methylase
MLENIAKKYDPTNPENDFDYWLIQYDFKSLNHFLLGDKVIELGCGRGILTNKLSEVCKELLVVEGSKNNINFAKKILKDKRNIDYYHSLWQKFDYPSNVSDIVFSMGLEHLDRKNAITILKKLKNCLQEDGRLHIIVPNANSLHRKVAYYMGIISDVHEFSERDKLYGHKRVYDKDMLYSELKECEYNVTHFEGIFLKPLPNSMMIEFKEEIIKGFGEISKEYPDESAHLYVVCEK